MRKGKKDLSDKIIIEFPFIYQTAVPNSAVQYLNLRPKHILVPPGFNFSQTTGNLKLYTIQTFFGEAERPGSLTLHRREAGCKIVRQC
jgi:hypothetical protein